MRTRRAAQETAYRVPATCGKSCAVRRRCHTGETHGWTALRPSGSRRPTSPPRLRRPRRRSSARARGASARRSSSAARGPEVGQGAAAAAAEGQAADDVGLDARLRRRLRADLGLEFAAGFVALLFIHEMGHYIQLRREGVKPSGMVFIPFLGAAVGTRSLGGSALAEARVGLAGPDPRLARHGRAAADRGRDRRRLLARARVHRLLPQPLQPAAGRPARRRPGDGGDGAVDVVRRLRRDGRAVLHLAEPDPDADRPARRLRDLPALEAAQAGRGGQRRVLPGHAARTGSLVASSTSG